MSNLHADQRRAAERAKGTQRALYTQQLIDAGDLRQKRLNEAHAELERIRGMLPGATHAGLSLTEIARLTGLSRTTLYQLQQQR